MRWQTHTDEAADVFGRGGGRVRARQRTRSNKVVDAFGRGNGRSGRVRTRQWTRSDEAVDVFAQGGEHVLHVFRYTLQMSGTVYTTHSHLLLQPGC